MGTFSSGIEKMIRTSDFDAYVFAFCHISPKMSTGNHTHSHMEFHCITEGSTIFKIDFDQEVVLNEGDWILINSGVYHEEIVPLFSSGFCIDFDIKMGSRSFFEEENDERPLIAMGNSREIMELLWLILRELQEKKSGYEDCYQALLTVFLIRMQQYDQRQSCTDIRKEESIRDTFFTIDAYFNRVFDNKGATLSLDKLAEELKVSRRHVNRLIKTRYGMTFGEKLMEARIRYAKYLLINTSCSVQEISERCGITSACLIKHFKQKYTKTPLQYRKLNKRDTT
jgi:AraC-like DNA-binding protein